MRKCWVNLNSALLLAFVVAAARYGLLWISTEQTSLSPFLPTLGVGEGGDGANPVVPSGSRPEIGGRRGAHPKKPGREVGGADAVEEKYTKKTMLLLGCFISVLSFSSPVIVHWSLGSSLSETITFHSLSDLIATTASSLAWLLFASTQLHTEDKGILGVEAVVVNVMGVAAYTLCTVIKMGAGDANIGTKGCIGALAALCGPTFIAICFVVFGPIKRDSPAAVWISFGAALVQVLSQFLPFRSFHTFFEAANVVSVVLALVTLALHLGYALQPQAAPG